MFTNVQMKRFFFLTASLMLVLFMFAATPVMAAGQSQSDYDTGVQQQLDNLDRQMEGLDPDSDEYKELKERRDKKQQEQDDIKKSQSGDEDVNKDREMKHGLAIKFENLFKNCSSYSDMFAEFKKCETCKVILWFFDAANYMTKSFANELSQPLIKLVGLCFGLWLAFETLKYFSTPASELDGAGYGTKVGTMLFRVMFGIVLIENGSSVVFEYFLEPFLDSTSRLVTVVAGGSLTSTGVPTKFVGAISADTRSAIDGMIGGFTIPLIKMQTVGFGLMCNGFYALEFPPDIVIEALKSVEEILPLSNIPQIGLPSTPMISFGCVLFLLFTAVAFFYALTFMDVVMRFALTVAFVPLAAAAWIFPATQKYATQVWKVFLNTALLFICTAAFLAIIVELLRNSFGEIFIEKAEASQFKDAYLSLSFLPRNTWILAHIAINPMPLVVTCVIAILACIGLKIPSEVAGRLADMGFGGQGLENCGQKALYNIIMMIIDIILLIITICTFGATSFIQAFEPVEKSEKAIRKIKKLKEYLEKLKKARKRVLQVKKQVNKAQELTGGGQDTV